MHKTILREGYDGVFLDNREDIIFVSFNDLPETIHQLTDALHEHHRTMKIPNENWLARQTRIARSQVLSWPTWKQKAMKDQL